MDYEFKPINELIDANFDTYRLKNSNIDVKKVPLDFDLFSPNYNDYEFSDLRISLVKSFNQLWCNPFDNNDLFIISSDGLLKRFRFSLVNSSYEFIDDVAKISISPDFIPNLVFLDRNSLLIQTKDKSVTFVTNGKSEELALENQIFFMHDAILDTNSLAFIASRLFEDGLKDNFARKGIEFLLVNIEKENSELKKPKVKFLERVYESYPNFVSLTRTVNIFGSNSVHRDYLMKAGFCPDDVENLSWFVDDLMLNMTLWFKHKIKFSKEDVSVKLNKKNAEDLTLDGDEDQNLTQIRLEINNNIILETIIKGEYLEEKGLTIDTNLKCLKVLLKLNRIVDAENIFIDDVKSEFPIMFSRETLTKNNPEDSQDVNFNSEQLEDVDLINDENFNLNYTVYNLETCCVVKKINLPGNDFLASVTLLSGNRPIQCPCLRFNFDGFVWREGNPGKMKHVASLNAFGYINASKSARKYAAIHPAVNDDSFQFFAIADFNSRIYVYQQPVEKNQNPECKVIKRNESAISQKVHTAWQQVITFTDDASEIVGFRAVNEPNASILVLTKNNFLYCINTI